MASRRTGGAGRVAARDRGGTDASAPEVAVDAALVSRWVAELEVLVTEAEQLLTELDAAIGDADHGTNMTRGLRAATAALSVATPAGPAEACREVGLALVRSIGGASGPLYGTVLVSMGDALPSTPEVTAQELAVALREGLRAVQRLGAAVAGDKTMIDAIAPAVATLEQHLAEGGTLPRAVELAAAAAEEGAVATIPMRARKGRASYLGARSEGHQDPGATSSAMLFVALSRTVRR